MLLGDDGKPLHMQKDASVGRGSSMGCASGIGSDGKNTNNPDIMDRDFRNLVVMMIMKIFKSKLKLLVI